ncbi:MFS transporter [Arthrobacter zhaoguopingii]|uniref:MFS transporter n=1 Tax=Arthrobacter zhaoguopingii TaxID=2681491 RepID=UPI00135B8891|nr:MFS transporter [Arthrobacter zhaoguopingii]
MQTTSEDNPVSAAVRSPLALPVFRRVLASNLVSATGNGMAPIALAFAVLQIGGTPLNLGIVLAANSIPTIIFLIVGGISADRWSRISIIFVSNLGLGATQGLVAWAVLFGFASTPLIIAAAVSGIFMAFNAPAAQGIVKQVVPEELLQQANSYLRLPGNVVRILAPVVGGVLVATAGAGWALLWDAVSFVIAALLIRGLKLGRTERSAPTSVVEDLKLGWQGFIGRTWLWTFTACGTVLVAFWLAGFQLLGPVLASLEYDGAGSWGLIHGALAFGLVAGTVVSLRWKPRHLLAVSVACSGALALPLLALGFQLPLWAVMGAAAFAGVALDVSIICWSTVLQQHIPDEVLGRVMAFNSIGERVAIPIAYVSIGALATSFSPGLLLLVCGIGIIAVTLINLGVRDVYRVNRTA